MRQCLQHRRQRIAGIAAALVLVALAAQAETFGELSGGGGNGGAMVVPYGAGPYAGAPGQTCPPSCYPVGAQPSWGGPEGMMPGITVGGPSPYVPPMAANPRAYLPLSGYGNGPDSPMMLNSFGQINATTDPFDPWGFSTPNMYVPWSTPMSGWTNAATWNWWRERSGALPRNW